MVHSFVTGDEIKEQLIVSCALAIAYLKELKKIDRKVGEECVYILTMPAPILLHVLLNIWKGNELN